jgi:hypothetical protein
MRVIAHSYEEVRDLKGEHAGIQDFEEYTFM